MMSENLRREDRVEARIKVLVVRGRRTIPLETSDVSFKGLFLCTDEPPNLRSLLRLRVVLPLREIEAHAMAVHVRTPDGDPTRTGVGVQFWGLAGPDRIAWDDFVKERLQEKKVALKKARASAAPPPPPAEAPAVDDKTPSGIRIAEALPATPTPRAAKG
jgi:hypothetical protein